MRQQIPLKSSKESDEDPVVFLSHPLVFQMQAFQTFSIVLCLPCLFLLSSMLSSCTPPQEDNIAQDLGTYLEKKKGWQEPEGRINAAIEIVRRDQFVHDDLTINVLSPFVGVAEEHVRALEEYLPKTPPVANIHQQYTEGWRAHQFALAALVDAAQRQDYVQLATAHTNLLQAQRTVLSTMATFTQFAEQAGVIEPTPVEEAAPSSSTSGEILVQ